MSAQTRVLIADDHPPTRAGIRASLGPAGFEICCEVGDASSAVAGVIDHRPDIALLDVHMPGSGISAAGEICRKAPDVVVVMLTVSRNDDDLFDALRAGATGYLLKDTDPDRLPIALRGVLDGEAAIPRGLVTKLVDEFRGREQRRSLPLIHKKGVRLTSREWEVLDLLKDELSTSQIADRLYVSPVTVRSHVSSLLKKLQVPDRKSAVKLLEEE